jgi:hypothetical protein
MNHVKKTPTITSDPQILGVLHRTGRTWQALAAARKNGQPEILAAREFTPDRLARLDEWLDEQNVGAVLCVLPAGAVICRTFSLPDAPSEQLEQALRLQAEAHLLGIAPPHRLGMAVLPNAAGETTRTGLVLAWPEAAVFPVPPTRRSMEFVPDVGAIAALLNGHRPNDAMLWLDREDGSVAMAITHSGGAIFRATREEATSTEHWQRSVGRIAAETALSVGHTGSFVEALARDAQSKAGELRASESRLFIPAEVISSATSRAKGLGADAMWWAQHGIAAGAALARFEGPLSALTRLQQSPPVETPTPILAAAQKLSRPQTAALVVIVCVLIAMFGPLAFAGARLGILKLRFGEVQTQLKHATTVKHQISMYKELENQNAWSMTKLLSDIAVYTPIGIELETIRVEGGKDFSVGGTAIAMDGKTPAQVVAQMQDNLRSHGMFTEIIVNAGKSDNLGRYKFDLSAKVHKPYHVPKLPEELDFGGTPYAVRLYGEAARAPGSASAPTAKPPSSIDEQQGGNTQVASNPDRGGRHPDALRETPPDDTNSASAIGSRAVFAGDTAGIDPTGRELQANPRPIPPALDPEQIKVMSVPELKDALSKVGAARQNRDLDQQTKDRLKAEWDLIMEHMRKAPKT